MTTNDSYYTTFSHDNSENIQIMVVNIFLQLFKKLNMASVKNNLVLTIITKLSHDSC